MLLDPDRVIVWNGCSSFHNHSKTIVLTEEFGRLLSALVPLKLHRISIDGSKVNLIFFEFNEGLPGKPALFPDLKDGSLHPAYGAFKTSFESSSFINVQKFWEVAFRFYISPLLTAKFTRVWHVLFYKEPIILLIYALDRKPKGSWKVDWSLATY